MARDETARLRAEIAEAADRLATAEQASRASLARLTAATSRAEELRREGDKEEVTQASVRVKLLQARHQDALAKLNRLQQTLATARAALLAPLPSPADAIKLLEPDQPIALLPVRIETRFAASATGGWELLTRIYPDEIHSDAHEPELTDDELAWGKAFAKELAVAKDADAQMRAWVKLASRFGPRRAAWVAEVTAPLDADGNPVTAPASPPRRGAAWSRAARAGALPDQWVLLGYQGGTRVLTHWFEAPVLEPLAVGPSPAPQVPDPGDDKLPLDDGMRWMVEFDSAVKAGMATRVPLTPQQEQQGFDLLIALGVKSTIDSAAGADRLEALLAAHHYTDGLEVSSPGVPTNNTSEDEARAREDPYHEESFAQARGPSRAKGGTDSAILADALGIDPLVLGRVKGADGSAEAAARAMNLALWPATWGYYLDQMMAEVFSETAIAAGRAHYVELVRGGGPLAPLRVGRQPYGVLPVTSLERWVPAEGGQYDSRLVSMLRSLRGVWRRALPAAPHIGRASPPDQDADLIELLGMEPASRAFYGRPLLGRDYLRNLQTFLGLTDVDEWWTAEEAAARSALASLNLPWDPRLVRAAFSPDARALSGSLVDEADPPAGGKRRGHDYMKLLTSSGLVHQELHNEVYDGDDYRHRALLYLLLRHSLLAEYASTTWAILVREQLKVRGDRGEPELVDLLPQPTETIWRLLDTPIPLTGGRTLGQYLDDHATPGQEPAARGLREWRAAVRSLQRLPTAQLERLMGETLDTASHRLDAWITSFAKKRLNWLRAQAGAGVQIGGYGWVENLRRSRTRGAPVSPPPDEAGSPLYEDSSSAGYVHAPSLAHASAAAVLRGGHLSNGRAADDPFAVDLSSERVRSAIELFEGVREGQPLGALLGYRFERGLHENHAGQFLDKYIPAFRELEPLAARKLIPSGEPLETIAAANVVDGLKLLERWRKPGAAGIPWGSGGLPSPTVRKSEYDAIVAELDSLDHAVDAMADAATAESIYQLVQGNTTRAGATLDGINRGEVPPPELEVARTPRSGIAVTHRLVTLVDEVPAGTGGWPAASRNRPRSLAEPRLNAWLERALGNPAKVRCEGVWTDSESGQPLGGFAPVPVHLDDLGLAAIDLIELSLAGGEAQQSELEGRVARKVAANPPANLPNDARLAISFARTASTPAPQRSFAELLEAARVLRELITQARPLERRDLEPPDTASSPSQDPAELKARADSAVAGLTAAAADNKLSSQTLAQLAAGLAKLADYGVPASLPSPWADLEELKKQVDPAVAEAKRRVAAAGEAAKRLTPAPPDHVKVQIHIERLRAVLGDGFPALPLFTAQASTQLDLAFSDSTKLQGGDSREADRWLSRAARVRPGAARLEEALLYTQALDVPLQRNLAVAQLPYESNDRWLGLPPTAQKPIRGGRLSLVAQRPLRGISRPLSGTEPLAGLMVDEWVEVVPARRETTAVGFHYDAPGAQAPQAILLALSPDPGAPWDLGTLESILLETLELAKLRTVDQDALGEVGHFLPALLFGFNSNNEAVSTDFRRSVG
jgi:hypothetical protein